MSPDGEDVVSGRPFRIRYVVENRSRRDRQVRIYKQLGTGKATLVGPRTLTPGERVIGEVAAVLKFGQKGIWVHVFEDHAPSGRCPAWITTAEPDTGSCQAADGAGMSVRPPSAP
jgi:hypothetical protein